jgi:hypothetical protein
MRTRSCSPSSISLKPFHQHVPFPAMSNTSKSNSCKAPLKILVQCMRETPCVVDEKKTLKECMHDRPTLEECSEFHSTYLKCKRKQVRLVTSYASPSLCCSPCPCRSSLCSSRYGSPPQRRGRAQNHPRRHRRRRSTCSHPLCRLTTFATLPPTSPQFDMRTRLTGNSQESTNVK